MPIELDSRGETDRTRIDRKVAIFDASEIDKLRPPAVEAEMPVAAPDEVAAATCTSSSSSSSSIGKNSESCGSDGEDLAGEKEVESTYKGPLNMLESLEESLPIRRGISSFYNGKSKSFASLSDTAVSCTSIKDIAKQENAYTRRRRNLVASKNFSLKSSSSSLRNNGGGISKKCPSNGRSMLAIAVAMNNINNIIPEDQEQRHSLLPPLHPSGKMMASSESPQYCSFTMRSFSLADLQGMAGKF